MAMQDFGVITFKNNQLLHNTEDGEEVRNGIAGEFTHYPTGVTFYRTTIKDHEDVNKATVRIDLYGELPYSNKRVMYSTVNGMEMKTKEIYGATYLTKFKDANGDRYTIIHGYDVGFSNFWSKSRGKVITKTIKKIQNKQGVTYNGR